MKLLVSATLAMGLAAGAAYADNHGGAANGDSTGCGLGTTIWAG